MPQNFLVLGELLMASPPPERPAHTVEQKRGYVGRLKKRIEELEAFNPETVQKRWSPEVEALENAINDVLSAVFGHGTAEYIRYRRAAELEYGPSTMGEVHEAHEAAKMSLRVNSGHLLFCGYGRSHQGDVPKAEIAIRPLNKKPRMIPGL